MIPRAHLIALDRKRAPLEPQNRAPSAWPLALGLLALAVAAFFAR